MPRILEMKVEGNDVWVKIENLTSEVSPVHLWTDEEAKHYYQRARAELLDEINEKFR